MTTEEKERKARLAVFKKQLSHSVERFGEICELFKTKNNAAKEKK